MLLLDITTFEPDKTMEINKRWEQVKYMDFPKGLNIINQWFDAGGGRVFTLFDVETIGDYMAYNLPFADLCKVEVVPIVEAAYFEKLVSECVEKMTKMGFTP